MPDIRRIQRWFAVAVVVTAMAIPHTAQAGGRYHKGDPVVGALAGAAVGLLALGAILGTGRHYAPAPRYYNQYSYSPRPTTRYHGHGGYGRQYHGYPRHNRRYYGHPRHNRHHYGHGYHGYRHYGY